MENWSYGDFEIRICSAVAVSAWRWQDARVPRRIPSIPRLPLAGRAPSGWVSRRRLPPPGGSRQSDGPTNEYRCSSLARHIRRSLRCRLTTRRTHRRQRGRRLECVDSRAELQDGDAADQVQPASWSGPLRCPGELANLSSWAVSGKQLTLYDAAGGTVSKTLFFRPIEVRRPDFRAGKTLVCHVSYLTT